MMPICVFSITKCYRSPAFGWRASRDAGARSRAPVGERGPLAWSWPLAWSCGLWRPPGVVLWAPLDRLQCGSAGALCRSPPPRLQLRRAGRALAVPAPVRVLEVFAQNLIPLRGRRRAACFPPCFPTAAGRARRACTPARAAWAREGARVPGGRPWPRATIGGRGALKHGSDKLTTPRAHVIVAPGYRRLVVLVPRSGDHKDRE
jgi:hypothetical protein